MKFTRRDALILLVGSVGIGILTDILVRQSIFGLNFLIWSVVWVVILILAAVDKHRWRVPFAIFGGLALLNAILVYVRIEPVVQLWSAVITVVCFALMAGILYAPNFMELQIVNRLMELLIGGVDVIHKNGTEAIDSFRRDHDGGQRPRRSFQAGTGIIIAVVLGLIFIALFAGADSVFGHSFSFVGTFFSNLGDWLGQYNLGRFISISFWVVVSAGLLLLIVGRLKPVEPAPNGVKPFLTVRDSTIILVTLCIIFAIFSLLQLRYLFIGGSLPDGLTYAEYARRGYGQLLIATLLASAAIYCSLAWIKNRMRTPAVTGLATALVALNGFIVLSAWKRLSLYESAYGWTMLRFIARLGLICIFLGSVLLVIWVLGKLSTRQLMGGAWYVIAVVLTAAAMLNPAGIIAEKNITERSQRDVPLDSRYVRSLSDDALPAICRYSPSLMNSYPDEYAALTKIDRFDMILDGGATPRQSNHGLAAHYTKSESFRKSLSKCVYTM